MPDRRIPRSRAPRATRVPRARLAIAAICGALLLAACAIQPEPVHLGSDECSQCRMMISEPQFASQALTTRGKAYKFDSIECLAAFARGDTVGDEDLHSLWVADFSAPNRWLDVQEAVFLRSDNLRSPMGAGLSAHADASAARRVQEEHGGELLSWDGLVAGLGSHGHAH